LEITLAIQLHLLAELAGGELASHLNYIWLDFFCYYKVVRIIRDFLSVLVSATSPLHFKDPLLRSNFFAFALH